MNDLYIDVEQVEEYHTASEVKAHLADPSFSARLAAAKRNPLVEYDAVGAIQTKCSNCAIARFSEAL
ncbi:MAG: hypothetical protein MRJ68_13185 [Nitrospira sp.]|nr:hypothetical protein [Nitrospira sp.]